MKRHFDISDSIEIRDVDIVGVACILSESFCFKINLLIVFSIDFVCSLLIVPSSCKCA